VLSQYLPILLQALLAVGFACSLLALTHLFGPRRDIAAKLRLLLDPQSYASYRKRLAGFNSVRSWEDVAAEWLQLIRSAV